MSEEWYLTEAQTGAGEWFRWNSAEAEAHPELLTAVSGFEAHAERNSTAASHATRWLKEDAMHEQACVTRILVAEGRLATFYALASGETTLTSSKKLERMGIRGGSRVGSSHVEWIARDRRAHPGAGRLALQHATDVALRVSGLQGNRALTLDSYDADTEKMWRAQGLHTSQPEGEDGLRRLYLPLFGLDYGSLKRTAAE